MYACVVNILYLNSFLQRGIVVAQVIYRNEGELKTCGATRNPEFPGPNRNRSGVEEHFEEYFRVGVGRGIKFRVGSGRGIFFFNRA